MLTNKGLKIWLFCFLWVFCGMLFAQVSAENRDDFGSENFLQGTLYVKFEENSVPYAKSSDRNCPISVLFPAKSAQTQYGLKPMAYSLHLFGNKSLDNVFRIEFDSVQKADSFIEQLKRDPRVVFVERVPRQTIMIPGSTAGRKENSGPDDYFFGNIDNIPTSWHLDMVGYSGIYGYYQGNEKVRVAVVDNAVWGEHEDLQLNPDNMYDTFWGVEGSSKPPKWVGQNQQGTAQSPSSAYIWSHGTHCAGVVGAITGNGIGVASLASGVTVLGVKTAENNAEDLARTVQGVIWAAENGADIISMSYGSSTHSLVEEAIYRSCVDRGIVMLAAAGNNGVAKENYPAAYPGVIAVGSLNSDGERSSFSNYGDWVDIWAPGGYYVRNGVADQMIQIFSTTYCISQYYGNKEAFEGKYYDAMAGTSMATPLAASAAALLLSYYPGMNAYEIKEVLARTSRNASIYVPDALALLESDTVRQVRDLRAGWTPKTLTAEVRWTAPRADGVTKYILYKDGKKLGETTELSYVCPLEDTVGFIGVQAVYGKETSLTRYTAIRIGALPPVGNLSSTPVMIPVRTNFRTRTIEIGADRDFDAVEIFNVQGSRILFESGNSRIIDLSGVARGIYIGRIWKNGMVSGIFRAVL